MRSATCVLVCHEDSEDRWEPYVCRAPEPCTTALRASSCTMTGACSTGAGH